MNTCVTKGRNDKPKKKKVSPEIRFKLWEKYVGDTLMGDCFCCYKNKITPVTNYMTFQAGHIKSEFNGGIISLDNMLPICKGCNVRMHTANWDDYVEKRGLRPRLYGGNIPLTTIKRIIKIQSWWHNLINKYKMIKSKRPKKHKKSKRQHRYYDPTYSFMRKCKEKKRKRRIIGWF
jgi:hypothetical protein